MKYLIFITLLVVHVTCLGRVLGDGEWTVGVSQHGKDTEIGAGLQYDFSHDSTYQLTRLNLSSEQSSSSDRSTNVNTHSRIYEIDKSSASLNHSLFFNSSINWQTYGNYDRSFLARTDSSNESWNFRTGPALYRKIRQDLTISGEVVSGRMKANNIESEIGRISLSGIKILPSYNEIGLSGERYCTDYDNEQYIDSCLDRVVAQYTIKGRNHVIDFTLGETIVDDTSEEVYGLSYRYNFSNTDRFNISYVKERTNLSTGIATIDTILADPSVTSKEEGKIGLQKSFKRLDLSGDVSRTVYENDQGTFTDKSAGVHLRYSLRSNMCGSCSLIYYQRKNELVNTSYEEQFFGVDFPVRPKLMGMLNIRRTKDLVVGEYYSLNFQIRYSSDRILVTAE